MLRHPGRVGAPGGRVVQTGLPSRVGPGACSQASFSSCCRWEPLRQAPGGASGAWDLGGPRVTVTGCGRGHGMAVSCLRPVNTPGPGSHTCLSSRTRRSRVTEKQVEEGADSPGSYS